MTLKDLFLEYVRTYNAKDVDGMLALFDDACVFENISAGKISLRIEGKGALAVLAHGAAEACLSRQQRVLSLTEESGRLVAEIDYEAVLQRDLSPDLKAGSELKLRGVSVVEYSGDKIARLSDYS